MDTQHKGRMMGTLQSTVHTATSAVGKVIPRVEVSFRRKGHLEDLSESRDTALVLDESQTRQALEIEARAAR